MRHFTAIVVILAILGLANAALMSYYRLRGEPAAEPISEPEPEPEPDPKPEPEPKLEVDEDEVEDDEEPLSVIALPLSSFRIVKVWPGIRSALSFKNPEGAKKTSMMDWLQRKGYFEQLSKNRYRSPLTRLTTLF